jgi:hypothetical protein
MGATWKPMNGLRSNVPYTNNIVCMFAQSSTNCTCHIIPLPCVIRMCHVSRMDVPHQSYGRATCHPCSGAMCQSVHPVNTLATSTHCACHCTLPHHSYNLYSQLPRGTVWIVQSSNFCLFGKTNRSRYLEHTTSV